jgi:hypothetical protein
MKTLTPLAYRLLKEVQANAPAYLSNEEETEAFKQLIAEGRGVLKATTVWINGVRNDTDYWQMSLTPAGLQAIRLWEQFGTLLSRSS